METLEPWVHAILADPITKQPIAAESFPNRQGVADARIFLKNTYGYSAWAEGQEDYENIASQDQTTVESYLAEIDYDRPIYTHYSLSGRILDCGGGGVVPFVNFFPRMCNLCPLILGCKPLLPIVQRESKRINV